MIAPRDESSHSRQNGPLGSVFRAYRFPSSSLQLGGHIFRVASRGHMWLGPVGGGGQASSPLRPAHYVRRCIITREDASTSFSKRTMIRLCDRPVPYRSLDVTLGFDTEHVLVLVCFFLCPVFGPTGSTSSCKCCRRKSRTHKPDLVQVEESKPLRIVPVYGNGQLLPTAIKPTGWVRAWMFPRLRFELCIQGCLFLCQPIFSSPFFSLFSLRSSPLI